MSKLLKYIGYSIGILILMQISIIVYILVSGGIGRASNLSKWEKSTHRPGFTLLDSAEVNDYYICVYDTGLDEIAFCYQWNGSSEEPTAHSLGVNDSNNDDLHDIYRKKTTSLRWERYYGIAVYAGCDGLVYPIKKGYRGKIRVDFTDGDASSDKYRLVYSKELDLSAESTEQDTPANVDEPRH